MSLTAVTPVEPFVNLSPVGDLEDGDEGCLRVVGSPEKMPVCLTRPSDKENDLVRVAARHGAAGILAVMRKHKDYGWLTVLALRAIQMCLGPRQGALELQPVLRECDPVAFAAEMLELEMVDEIFQIMRYFLHVRDIQHHGLAIIEILIMDDPEWRDEVARKGGVSLLVDIAKLRKDTPNIMCQVMTCMAYLAAEDYIEVMLCQHDALQYVSYIIQAYVENIELVTRASLALLNLTVCEPHIEELMEKGAVVPVLTVLQRHPKDIHLVIILMGVLTNFSVKMDVRRVLVKERVFDLVAAAMRLDSCNAVLQVACLKAIVNYSSDAEHYVVMESLGIPTLVGKTMVDHADDLGVQRYGNYFLGYHTRCPIM